METGSLNPDGQADTQAARQIHYVYIYIYIYISLSVSLSLSIYK